MERITPLTLGRRHRVGLGLTVLALAAGACTSAGDETADLPGSLPMGDDVAVETSAVAFENPTAEEFNLLLTSEDDLTSLRPVDLLSVDVADEAGTTLVVTFEMESHHCFGVSTSVSEGPNEVAIELLTGLRPDVSRVSCELGVYPYTTEIVLAEPLGDRAVVPAEPREPEPVAEVDPAIDTPIEDTPETPAAQPTVEDSIGEVDVLPPPDAAAELVGQYIEDAIEWSIVNDVEWGIVSIDGEPFDGEPVGEGGIRFVVENDRVVSYERT